MSPQALRGSYIYLALAVLVVSTNALALAMELLGSRERMEFGSMALSLAMIVAMIMLWWGNPTLRGVMGALAIMKGIVGIFGVVRVYLALRSKLTPEQWETLWNIVGYTMPLFLVFALCNIAIGCMILYLPSIQAFFRHQRGEDSHGWRVEEL